MTNDRFRRPDPDRTVPIRRWQSAQQSAEAWQTPPSAQPDATTDEPTSAGPRHTESTEHRAEDPWGSRPEEPSPWQDSVGRGVEMGYRVVEEQIRLGQEMARQFGIGTPPNAPYGEDPLNMLRRALRYSEDMAGLVFQFLGSLAQRPDLTSSFTGTTSRNGAPQDPWRSPWPTPRDSRVYDRTPWQSPFNAPPQDPWSPDTSPWNAPSPRSFEGHASHRDQGQTLMADIRCQRPTRLRLELAPGAMLRPLHCSELTAADQDARLSDVQFAADGSNNLIIQVPVDQPPGLYMGSIIDKELGTPLGCVSLQIPEQHAERGDFPRVVVSDGGDE